MNDAIESGGWWQQFGAVALLRLTPVVPFRYVPGYNQLHCAVNVSLPAQLPCLSALHRCASLFCRHTQVLPGHPPALLCFYLDVLQHRWDLQQYLLQRYTCRLPPC